MTQIDPEPSDDVFMSNGCLLEGRRFEGAGAKGRSTPKAVTCNFLERKSAILIRVAASRNSDRQPPTYCVEKLKFSDSLKSRKMVLRIKKQSIPCMQID